LPWLTGLSRFTCVPLFAHVALSAGVALLISAFARIVRTVALLGGIARLALRPRLISRLFRILTIAVAFATGNSRGSAFSRTASATAPSATPTAPTTARLAAWATIRAIAAATAIHPLLTGTFYPTLR
jgi:hypothetical protein